MNKESEKLAGRVNLGCEAIAIFAVMSIVVAVGLCGLAWFFLG